VVRNYFGGQSKELGVRSQKIGVGVRSMEPARSFRDVIAWRKAHMLTLMVYEYTRRFPKEELFALTNQFRRATVSVAANIAEGFAKHSNRDKIRFLNIAQGSLSECQYYILLAKDLGFGENQALEELAEQTSKLLTAYSNAIKRRIEIQ
jgi:four helix bundle protein